MNNKGFTLVELLSVIVILAGISVVVVTGIGSSLEKRDKKECEEQIALAKNAAKIYFSLNDQTSVTVKQLKANNYFNETSKIDKLDIDHDSVELKDNKYKYIGKGECKES